MHKKLLCAVLCFTVLFSLSSCSFFGVEAEPDDSGTDVSTFENTSSFFDDSSEHFNVGSVEPNISSAYEKIELQNGYNMLTSDGQRECYNSMRSAVLSVSNEQTPDGNYLIDRIKVPGVSLSNSELRFVIAAFLDDNPQVFWLDSTFGYANSGFDTYLQMYSLVSADKLKDMIADFNSTVKEIVESIPSGLDEFDRELYIHDFIVDNCSYDESIEVISDGFEAFTPYGALVEGKAVCEGYSRSMQLLLKYVGIKSVNVIGTGRQQLHMWNAVQLGESWYYLDATWNDTDDYSRYDYFNVTTSQIKNDHKIAGLYSDYTAEQICGDSGMSPVNFNIFVPQCDNTGENYYEKNAVKLYGFGGEYDEAVIEELVDMALQGEHYLNIYVDPLSLDYDIAYSELFGESTNRFFSYIYTANSRLSTSYEINKDSVSVVQKTDKNIITVKLNYI